MEDCNRDVSFVLPSADFDFEEIIDALTAISGGVAEGKSPVYCLNHLDDGRFEATFRTAVQYNTALRNGEFVYKDSQVMLTPMTRNQIVIITVKYLPAMMDNDTISEYFSQFGEVLDIEMVSINSELDIRSTDRKILIYVMESVPSVVNIAGSVGFVHSVVPAHKSDSTAESSAITDESEIHKVDEDSKSYPETPAKIKVNEGLDNSQEDKGFTRKSAVDPNNPDLNLEITADHYSSTTDSKEEKNTEVKSEDNNDGAEIKLVLNHSKLLPEQEDLKMELSPDLNQSQADDLNETLYANQCSEVKSELEVVDISTSTSSDKGKTESIIHPDKLTADVQPDMLKNIEELNKDLITSEIADELKMNSKLETFVSETVDELKTESKPDLNQAKDNDEDRAESMSSLGQINKTGELKTLSKDNHDQVKGGDEKGTESNSDPQKLKDSDGKRIESVSNSDQLNQNGDLKTDSKPNPDQEKGTDEKETESNPDPDQIKENDGKGTESISSPNEIDQSGELQPLSRPDPNQEKVTDEKLIESYLDPDQIKDSDEKGAESNSDPEQVKDSDRNRKESMSNSDQINENNLKIDSKSNPDKATDSEAKDSMSSQNQVDQSGEVKTESKTDPEQQKQSDEKLTELNSDPDQITDSDEKGTESMSSPDQIGQSGELKTLSSPDIDYKKSSDVKGTELKPDTDKIKGSAKKETEINSDPNQIKDSDQKGAELKSSPNQNRVLKTLSKPDSDQINDSDEKGTKSVPNSDQIDQSDELKTLSDFDQILDSDRKEIESMPIPDQINDSNEKGTESNADPDQITDSDEKGAESVTNSDQIDQSEELILLLKPDPDQEKDTDEKGTESNAVPDEIIDSDEKGTDSVPNSDTSEELKSLSQPDPDQEKDTAEKGTESNADRDQITDGDEKGTESVPNSDQIDQSEELKILSDFDQILHSDRKEIDSMPIPDQITDSDEKGVESKADPNQMTDRDEKGTESVPNSDQIDQSEELRSILKPDPDQEKDTAEKGTESNADRDQITDGDEKGTESVPNSDQIDQSEELKILSDFDQILHSDRKEIDSMPIPDQITDSDEKGVESKADPNQMTDRDEKGTESVPNSDQIDQSEELRSILKPDPDQEKDAAVKGTESNAVPDEITDGDEKGTESKADPNQMTDSDEKGTESVPNSDQIDQSEELKTLLKPDPDQKEDANEKGIESNPDPYQINDSNEKGNESNADPYEINDSDGKRIESNADPDQIIDIDEKGTESVPNSDQIDQSEELRTLSNSYSGQIIDNDKKGTELNSDLDQIIESNQKGIESMSSPNHIHQTSEFKTLSMIDPDQINDSDDKVTESIFSPDQISQNIDLKAESKPNVEQLKSNDDSETDSKLDPSQTIDNNKLKAEGEPDADELKAEVNTDQTEVIQSDELNTQTTMNLIKLEDNGGAEMKNKVNCNNLETENKQEFKCEIEASDKLRSEFEFKTNLDVDDTECKREVKNTSADDVLKLKCESELQIELDFDVNHSEDLKEFNSALITAELQQITGHSLELLNLKDDSKLFLIQSESANGLKMDPMPYPLSRSESMNDVKTELEQSSNNLEGRKELKMELENEQCKLVNNKDLQISSNHQLNKLRESKELPEQNVVNSIDENELQMPQSLKEDSFETDSLEEMAVKSNQLDDDLKVQSKSILKQDNQEQLNENLHQSLNDGVSYVNLSLSSVSKGKGFIEVDHQDFNETENICENIDLELLRSKIEESIEKCEIKRKELEDDIKAKTSMKSEVQQAVVSLDGMMYLVNEMEKDISSANEDNLDAQMEDSKSDTESSCSLPAHLNIINSFEEDNSEFSGNRFLSRQASEEDILDSLLDVSSTIKHAEEINAEKCRLIEEEITQVKQTISQLISTENIESIPDFEVETVESNDTLVVDKDGATKVSDPDLEGTNEEKKVDANNCGDSPRIENSEDDVKLITKEAHQEEKEIRNLNVKKVGVINQEIPTILEINDEHITLRKMSPASVEISNCTNIHIVRMDRFENGDIKNLHERSSVMEITSIVSSDKEHDSKSTDISEHETKSLPNNSNFQQVIDEKLEAIVETVDDSIKHLQTTVQEVHNMKSKHAILTDVINDTTAHETEYLQNDLERSKANERHILQDEEIENSIPSNFNQNKLFEKKLDAISQTVDDSIKHLQNTVSKVHNMKKTNSTLTNAISVNKDDQQKRSRVSSRETQYSHGMPAEAEGIEKSIGISSTKRETFELDIAEPIQMQINGFENVMDVLNKAVDTTEQVRVQMKGIREIMTTLSMTVNGIKDQVQEQISGVEFLRNTTESSEIGEKEQEVSKPRENDADQDGNNACTLSAILIPTKAKKEFEENNNMDHVLEALDKTESMAEQAQIQLQYIDHVRDTLCHTINAAEFVKEQMEDIDIFVEPCTLILNENSHQQT